MFDYLTLKPALSFPDPADPSCKVWQEFDVYAAFEAAKRGNLGEGKCEWRLYGSAPNNKMQLIATFKTYDEGMALIHGITGFMRHLLDEAADDSIDGFESLRSGLEDFINQCSNEERP